jgi:hypothetical protein
LPQRLELIPTTDSEGRCTQWEGGTTFSLSAPILEASIQDLLDNDFHRNAWEVLRSWISNDLDNLQRIRAGLHSFKMPADYRTNSTAHRAWAIQGITRAENIERALEHLKESLSWISSQLYHRGDLSGATRCAMLLRHFFPDDRTGVTHDTFLHNTINDQVSGSARYLYAGVDALNAMIDHKLTNPSNEAPR